jgi:hypothetical protein
LKKSRDFRFSVADALGARVVQRAWRMHKKRRIKSGGTSSGGNSTRLSSSTTAESSEIVIAK